MKSNCSVRTTSYNGMATHPTIELVEFEDCESAMRDFIAKKSAMESQESGVLIRVASVELIAEDQ